MPLPLEPGEWALGVCTADRQVFVVCGAEGTCTFCGKPPDLMAGLVGPGVPVGDTLAGGPADAENEPVDVEYPCPACGEAVIIRITPDEITLVKPDAPAGTPSPAESGSTEVGQEAHADAAPAEPGAAASSEPVDQPAGSDAAPTAADGP